MSTLTQTDLGKTPGGPHLLRDRDRGLTIVQRERGGDEFDCFIDTPIIDGVAVPEGAERPPRAQAGSFTIPNAARLLTTALVESRTRQMFPDLYREDGTNANEENTAP